MTITSTLLPEVLLIKPQKLEDERGWFMESFRKSQLEKAVGHNLHFCQENQAQSSYGVIRGLHYQIPPHAQSKLFSVLQGEVLDIVVDIRKGSPNFGKHLAIELNDINQKQLFIPRGFAHGYSCLSESALVSYKVDNYYNKNSEASISFNDPQLAIDWKIPLKLQKLSPKDYHQPTFDADHHFDYKQPFYE